MIKNAGNVGFLPTCIGFSALWRFGKSDKILVENGNHLSKITEECLTTEGFLKK